MTLLGKIMTFVVLIMSIAFGVMGMMTYASHKNWRQAAEDLKAEYTEKANSLEQQKKRIDELKLQVAQEKVARAQAISNLYAEGSDLAKQNARLTTERNNLRNQASDLQNTLAQSSKRVLDLDQQNSKLRAQKIALIDSIQFQQGQVVRLIDEIHRTDYTKETLRERAEQLASDIAEYERVMVAFNLDKNSLTDFIPPAVDGKITAVSKVSKDRVQISLGENDGLKKGHEFDVLRGPDYVGRMKLISVDSNTAVGRMVLQEMPVRVNDRVTTRMVLDSKYNVSASK